MSFRLSGRRSRLEGEEVAIQSFQRRKLQGSDEREGGGQLRKGLEVTLEVELVLEATKASRPQTTVYHASLYAPGEKCARLGLKQR